MDNDRAALGALILVLLIVGANAIMYGIVRGFVRGGKANWMNALRNSLNQTRQGHADKSMDDLRKKVEELRRNGEEKEE